MSEQPNDAKKGFYIVEHDALKAVEYDWGAVKWVCNDALAPGTDLSFGLVHVLPGRTNPEHWHTSAIEVVYMLAGVCDMKFDDKWVSLKPGQTLVIPPGVKHTLKNNGWEPAVYVASFSRSFRETKFSEQEAAKTSGQPPPKY
jgi:quercetin dioxygenase-like cupin family protein